MPEFGPIAERLRRATVEVHSEGRGYGSGIIWNSSGLILTNAHVVHGREARVELWDRRRFTAQVTARDARRDLAALRIDAPDLEAAEPASLAPPSPGELVIAIGSPLGFSGALSTGVVHSVGPVDGMGTRTWIRSSVRLAPGNSGGPLANASGQVIGINTAIMNGLGLAAPVGDVAEFLVRGPRPALGVTLRPQPPGLLILEMDADGAAARASLREGDLLLISLEELNAALDQGPEVLRLRFVRGGFSAGRTPVRETRVQLGARAEAA